MSRHSTGGYSYSHGIKRFASDHYLLFWTVDFYYPTSQLRHPRGFSRDTDEAGAIRFAKKWGTRLPVVAGTKLPEAAPDDAGKAGNIPTNHAAARANAGY